MGAYRFTPELDGPRFIGKDNLYKGSIGGKIRMTIQYENGLADIFENLTSKQIGREIGRIVSVESFAGRKVKIY